MKVVINKCYGGFDLSAIATKRLAELQGRNCYFFEIDYKTESDKYIPVSLENANKIFTFAFDIPNPNDILAHKKPWNEMSIAERKNSNNLHDQHSIRVRELERSDPLLIQIVEELGERANTRFSQLEIVEIPDGVEFVIEEYDGIEHIAEAHRTWG